VLAGLGAAALVNGIQETGVVATIKHLCVMIRNMRGMGRMLIITERALREIYALAFSVVVRDRIRGVLCRRIIRLMVACSENPKILRICVRGEWAGGVYYE